MAETVETAVYRLRVEGQAEIDRLAKSVDGLAVAEEKATASNRTFSQALQNNVARIDPLIRAQEQYRKALETNLKYRETGVGTETQLNAQLETSTKRYQQQISVINQVEKATVSHTNAQKLQGYQMLNLSRQIQDIGVSLFGGQSPLTVAVQQIPQIADISQQSGVSMTNMFKQAGAAALGFITPVRLAIGGIAGIGAAAVYSAAQFASAQKEIERSLLGIGGQSGATAAKINAFAQIGPQQSITGMSIGEKREAGTTFAQAGVDVSKLKGVEDAIRGYAIVAGTDATKATQALAAALGGDLVKAVDDLEKVYGALDPKLKDTVQAMLLVNDKAGAQQAIMDAVAAANKRALDTITPLSVAWSALINIAQMVGEGWLKILSYRVFETPGQRAAAAAKEVEAAAAAAQQQANQIQKQGRAVVNTYEPEIQQIDKLKQALADLVRAKEAAATAGKTFDDSGAEQKIRNLITLTQQAQEESVRYQARVAEIAAKWSDVGMAVALQLQTLQNNLQVLQAVGGAAKMAAQYAADYANAIDKGKTAAEATALAAAGLAAAQAQANSSAKETLWNLQNQAAAAAAVTDEQKRSAEAEATKNKLIHDGVDAQLAASVAAQQSANAEATAKANERKAEDSAREAALAAQRKAAQEAMNEADKVARAWGRWETEAGKSVNPAVLIMEKILGMSHSLEDSTKILADNTAILAQNLAAGADSAVSMNYSFLTSQNTVNTGSTKRGSGGWNASFAGGAFDVPGGKTGVSVSTLDPLTMSLFQNPMQAPSYSDLVNQAMLGGTGSALAFAMGQQAHGQVAQMIPGIGGQFMATGGVAAQAVTESEIISQVQSLFQLQQSQTTDKAAQGQSMQAELAWLQSRPQSLEQQQAIISLKQSIDDLTKSTDDLNATNQDLLSPYYTQDPRTSHIGFRSQGMALGGYVDVPGGYSSNDNMVATIPVASGERIFVDPMGAKRGVTSGDHTTINISTPILIQGNANKDELGRTLYQSNQALAKQIGAATAR